MRNYWLRQVRVGAVCRQPPSSNPAVAVRSARRGRGSVTGVPIVDVELVSDADPPPSMTQRLADVLGEALWSRPQGTWVRLRRLERDRYAENGGAAHDVQPVFVTVLERVRPTGQELHERIARVTAAVAEVTGCDPDHVHVLYDADARGRLAFGGRLVE
jgi:phenylpyruvate tautomerase PptA (4-oxalocrotonate tautomerase family)